MEIVDSEDSTSILMDSVDMEVASDMDLVDLMVESVVDLEKDISVRFENIFLSSNFLTMDHNV
jgi:hypothetical protein